MPALATTREAIVNALCELGVFPTWRTDDTSGIIDGARALAEVGMNNVELTMTTPGNLQLIERARKELPNCYVGAGTVYDAETARLAILAGAQYIVCPVLAPDIAVVCRRYGVAAILSAFSPTEILAAKTAGADIVKVHPCGGGGPAMMWEMRGPFPGLRLIATGGVMLGDIAHYMEAGVDAVVIGLPHIAIEAYKKRDFAAMQKVAKRVLSAIREGRDPERRKAYVENLMKRYVDFDGGATRAAKGSA